MDPTDLRKVQRFGKMNKLFQKYKVNAYLLENTRAQ